MGGLHNRLTVPLAIVLAFSSLLGTTATAATSTATDAAQGSHGPDRDVATFRLSAPPNVAAKEGPVTIRLHCDGRVAANAVLHFPGRTEVTMPLRYLGGQCQVEVESKAREGFTDEITISVAANEGMLERSTQYSHEGTAISRAFTQQSGDLAIDVMIGTMPDDEVGTSLKVMSFNIWQGGNLDGRFDHGFEGENKDQLLDFIRAENPDVLFLVETYGLGDRVLEALNRDQPEGRQYIGVQVTREPGQAPDRDNLWLYTWLPVEEVYPVIRSGGLTSFNFGGARLGLPDGSHFHAFSTWLYHLGNTWSPVTQSAMENAFGLDRTFTDEELLATDDVRRMKMARTLLDERLPAYIGDDTAPVILGGDFNTLSQLDWSEQFASGAGHEGLVLDWPVLGAFEEAGFTDTYRYANPDAGRYPGRTWSAAQSFMYAPIRMDYILTRGEQVRVLASSTRSTRLPEQQGGGLDELYPFYSDHAALVTELVIRGKGTGPDSNKPVVFDPPELEGPAWPDPLPGMPIPAEEMTATATSVRPGSEPDKAIDGDVRTIWHSRSQPNPPDFYPQSLTVDLGQERVLTGVRYQPRIDGYYGIVTRYTLQASDDGETFDTVASGIWARDSLPKNIELSDVSARYLRLVAEAGVGGFTSVAEFTPFVKVLN